MNKESDRLKLAESDRLKLAESLKSRGDKSATDPKIQASQKRSITLYQTDLDILDEIRHYLRQKGIRNLSDSEGLRLACRTLSFDDRLLTTYEAMKMEDGRRRKR